MQIKTSAILLTYNGLQCYEKFKTAMMQKLHDKDRYAICEEQTPKQKEEDRVHHHAFIWRHTGQIDCSSDHYTIDGVHPNVQCNTSKGAATAVSCQRGMFYVETEFKTTHIKSDTNYYAGHDYAVKQKWIMDLYQTNKCKRALEAMAHYSCLTPAGEAQVRMSDSRRMKDAKSEALKERQAYLQTTYSPFGSLYDVEQVWLPQYEHVKDRYDFLVVFGRSKTGKTNYCRSLFKNPFLHRDSVCWNGYDPDLHDCVIFDDVKSVYKYVNENRALFQAGSSVMVQTSLTNIFAISIDCTQKPLIITTNTEPTGDWILANSVCIPVGDPLWMDDRS